MNTREIEILLERFYDGTTTTEEENRLKEYFRSGDYPPELAPEATYFRFCEYAASIRMQDPDFVPRIQEHLNEPPVIRMEQSRNRLFTLAGIAATLLLLAGLFLTIRQEVRRNSEPGLIRDPQIAYVEAQKALLLLSANFNTGIENMQQFSRFDKGVNAMKHFSGFYKYQTITIQPNEINQSKQSN